MCKIFFGAVLLALLFTRAGFWQLDRARQKQNLAAAMEERARLPPLRLSGAINKDEALRYRKVVATGSRAFLGATFGVQDRIEGLFIVDPQSNLILRYESRADPEGVLKDLKRLLKYSWIG